MYVWEQQCNNKNDEEGMQFSNGAVVACALRGIFGLLVAPATKIRLFPTTTIVP